MHDKDPNLQSQPVEQPESVEVGQTKEQQPGRKSFFRRLGSAARFTAELPVIIRDAISGPKPPYYKPPTQYEMALDATMKVIQEIRDDPNLSDEEKAKREMRVMQGMIESAR